MGFRGFSGHSNAPLPRMFVPSEKKTSNGTIVFRTTDRMVYARIGEGGPIHRAIPKARGKAARAADKRQRRMERQIKEKRLSMAPSKDPRTDRHPNDGVPGSYPTPEGEPQHAPGGAGTGTQDDPGKDPDARPGTRRDDDNDRRD